LAVVETVENRASENKVGIAPAMLGKASHPETLATLASEAEKSH
jgi:hypothetical protein